MASNSVNEPKGGSKSGMLWVLAIIILAAIIWYFVAGRTPTIP